MIAVPQSVVRRALTLEDYEALPDDNDYEIIEGVLYVSPRARPLHQQIALRLGMMLGGLEEQGLGVVIPDADLIVDARNTYVSPDLMWFEGSRFEAVDRLSYIRITPDLVVEVLSPSTRDYDLGTKRETYARLGVKHYWIADPERRAVLENVLQEDGTYLESTMRAPEVFRPVLFPELELNLARVFR
jgi:Uma2 family endonuclease